jgi:hypothetical protein
VLDLRLHQAIDFVAIPSLTISSSLNESSWYLSNLEIGIETGVVDRWSRASLPISMSQNVSLDGQLCAACTSDGMT